MIVSRSAPPRNHITGGAHFSHKNRSLRAADCSSHVLCKNRCWCLMRLDAMEKAAYMPDKHSTFICSRFVLVSKERHVPDSIASQFGSISPNSNARHHVHASCAFR